MDRDAFFARIRTATAAGRAHPIELDPHATAEGSYVGGGADPVATFLQEWIGVGGLGVRVSGAAAAQAYLCELCERHGVKSVLSWKHPLLDRLGIDSLLESRQIEVRRWDRLEQESPVQRWQQAFSADLGITSVDWAIAETGTLTLCSRLGQGRSCSLLPPLHIAILEPSQIVPDLFDLFLALEADKPGLPSNLVFVTGPSKTGDIELKLTTGVHGPGEVHVLVVEGL